MTPEDILRMGREAGFDQWDGTSNHFLSLMERFHEIAAAAEREACAKLCESEMVAYSSPEYTTDPLGGFRERFAAQQCADAIRARGNQ